MSKKINQYDLNSKCEQAYKLRRALFKSALAVTLLSASVFVFAASSRVSLDGVSYTSTSANNSTGWKAASGGDNLVYDNGSSSSSNGAVIYSGDVYQSENGLRLSVYFNTSSISNAGGHELAFGLVRDDGNLATPEVKDPFAEGSSVYGIGVEITGGQRGIRFTNTNKLITLDTSGTRVNFAAGQTNKLTLEVARGGHWTYRINDIYEESGVIMEGIDLDSSYRFAAYGNGGSASSTVMAVSIEDNYATGERADNVRSSWGIGTSGLVIDQLSDFKTVDFVAVDFNSGASQSALHYAPNKLLETLANGESENLHVPTWGNLNRSEPKNDPKLADMLAIRESGLQVQAYTNSEGFAGNNGDDYEVLATRFKNWCDTNSAAKVFLNKPYITGTWNSGRGEYVDTGKFPNRKYMFCYAEYVLKDYSLRYGKYIDRWVFDSGSSMTSIGGDVVTSGVIEDQRIYQAFADAAHAGGPDIPLAFNNGRSNGEAAPFSSPLFFDDFMFGHAYGGNNSHAVKGGTFDNNLRFVTRMEETDGSVFKGGRNTWDDEIVGHFSSKVGTTAWKYGPDKAWEDDDFLEWNLRAMQAGGSMSWGGSIPRNGTPVLRDWAFDLYKKLDDYLVANETPRQPSWTKGITYLPPATDGRSYSYTLKQEEHFFDPRGRDVFLSLGADAPNWLSITESPANSGSWELSGTPQDFIGTLMFDLIAAEANSSSATRQVELTIEGSDSPTIVVPGGDSLISSIVETSALTPETAIGKIVTITKRNALEFAIDGGNDATNGQNVKLWQYNSRNNNQKWLEIDRGNGLYSYQKLGTDYCIDGNNGGTIKQNVWLWTCSVKNTNQNWKKTSVGSGYYRLEKANAPGFVLNGQKGGANDQNINLWDTGSSHNLQWLIINR